MRGDSREGLFSSGRPVGCADAIDGGRGGRVGKPIYLPDLSELRYAHTPNDARYYTTHPTDIRP